MTAYSVTRPEDLDRENGVVVDIPSRADLLLQNEQLRRDLDAAKVDAEVWHNAWATAVNNRVEDRERVSRSMRVLASLGRLSPRMAAAVEAARREVYGELP